MELTHINQNGEAHMVHVGVKDATDRSAMAEAKVFMRPETLAIIRSGNAKKGDVLATARIAAIMAAKRTHELIPLCHPLPISGVEVEIEPCGIDVLSVRCTVRCTHQTGVEMEALTGASVGALTIYDMCKAVDRAMVIGETRLLYKNGGKSGLFERKTELEGIVLVEDAVVVLASDFDEGTVELPQTIMLAVTDLEELSVGQNIRFGAVVLEIVEIDNKNDRACFAKAKVLCGGEIHPGSTFETV